MTALPVEWVLVIFYNLAAHKATYGRRPGSAGYTKDYIQLSQKSDFLGSLKRIFATGSANVPLTFKWPMGAAPGELVFRSADRPHLK